MTQTNPQSSIYTVRTDCGIIVIEGLFLPTAPTMTVTNDAEAVIKDLARRGFNLALPIIYRDSNGQWDGLAVENGAFHDFILLECLSYPEARAAARQCEAQH